MEVIDAKQALSDEESGHMPRVKFYVLTAKLDPKPVCTLGVFRDVPKAKSAAATWHTAHFRDTIQWRESPYSVSYGDCIHVQYQIQVYALDVLGDVYREAEMKLITPR